MKKTLIVMGVVLPSLVYAQQPPYVPYTIDAQEHQALMNYLGEQPAKFSMPVINTLNQFEQQAQQKKAAGDAVTKKKEESKKPQEKQP